MKHLFRRIAAALIDFCCILLYAGLLYSIASLLHLQGTVLSPFAGQLVGLVSLTIPVLCWFACWENSHYQATPGKQLMHLKVLREGAIASILLRNIMKFLPWEIAHAGVHWLIWYDLAEMGIPVWVMCLLIVPQIVMGIYALSVVLDKKGRSLYDKAAGTRVV